jgi:hypothetical protein
MILWLYNRSAISGRAKVITTWKGARKLWLTEQATDFYGHITENKFPII